VDKKPKAKWDIKPKQNPQIDPEFMKTVEQVKEE